MADEHTEAQERRQRVDDALRVADSVLRVVPSIPGTAVDDVAVGAARTVLAIVREWIREGRGVDELREVLDTYIAAPPDTMDLRARARSLLEREGLPVPPELEG